MGTYFHGSSEIQAANADGLHTLYLMNPNYVPYSDTQNQHHSAPNILLLNPASTHALNPANLSHAPPPNSHLLGIPLPTNNSNDPNRSSFLGQHEIPASRTNYNLWGPLIDHHQHQQQGLSLSLSSQQPGNYGYGSVSVSGEHDVAGHTQVQVISPTSRDDLRVSTNSPSSVSAVSNGINSGMQQSVVLRSKYLKAIQELLDDVVNVGNGIKVEGTKDKMKMHKESTVVIGDGPGESSTKQGAELTTAQRQELQMKKAKLVTMLDEVEQRYRQYHHQMQIVVSSFEQAAGLGSARSYTALALETISKQFRCLKDAISSQIKATSKSLGEEDCLGAKAEGSRLKYVDQQLRQQRALHQLGMLQHNAWRPQRGLPERAVTVLRAWLFDHFLHPYPKDSDKIMLAKQTGLTRSQVSNWFINARVRLWKPMVEEMYLEEFKEHERNDSEDNINQRESNKEGSTTIAPEDSAGTRLDQIKAFQSKPEKFTYQIASPTEISNSSMSKSPMGSGSIQAHSGFNLVGLSDTQRSPKKPRSFEIQNSSNNILSMDMDMDMKPDETSGGISINFGSERQAKDGYSLISSTSGFGAYPIGDIGRFNPEQLAPRFHGNGVSLTLGLPHCENLSLSGTQQSYLSHQNIQMGRRLEMSTGETDFCGISTPQPSHSNSGYDNIDIQNRERFVAQLLPDYVA
ncbi:BEL1-like homeodomain protein 1 isoform X1 [Fagus crenata]